MAAKNTIRFLKTAKISFSSFDTRATGACEFYRQMTAGKTRAVNPKADVLYTTTLHGSAPTIKLDFINGSKQTLEVPGKNVREIFDEVDFFCSQIETEYEQQGKSIE
uniref:Ribosomal protein/NADH dehydrogenase domain-containing protein n=1 Tax=Globisporangium ultimum (strain ATCC 200006 / CBS 805.95 / DAOM BR144) TaxID=431595 RepID=K3WSW9_GLOUD